MNKGILSMKKEKPVLDEKTKNMRDGDIIISILLILVSIWTAYESLRMSYEMYSRGLADFYTVPGLSPFIVSVLILICAIVVLVNAIRVGGDLKFLSPTVLKKTFSSLETFTPIIVIGLMWIYVFILVDRIPFTIATFIFIVLLMVIFKATRLIWTLLISALYSVAIVYFFAKIVGTIFPITLFFNG